MKIVLSLLFTILTLFVGLAGFIVIIATGKEGLALSDLWLFASVIGIFLLIILLWVWIFIKTHSRAIKIISIINLIYMAIPLLLALFVVGYIINNTFQARRLETNTVISSYQEKLITWPTMPYPVGLAVALTIEDGAKLANRSRVGDLVLWMGPDGMVTMNTLYRYNQNPFAKLQPVIFNKHLQPPQDTPNGSNLTIVRYLYPSVIAYIQSPNAFCKSDYENTKVVNYYSSPHLNGVLFWHQSGASSEITGQVRYLLQTQSKLENNPELWTQMHQQFDDNALFANGFKKCTIESRKNCFCK